VRQAPFEQAHRAEWQAFERQLGGRGEAAEDLPSRYRRLCQGLALATQRQYSPDLVDWLNALALRGHHVLYGAASRRPQRVADFLLAEFPALVRHEWRLVAAAALLFFGPMLLLIGVLQVFPEFVHYVLSPRDIAGFHDMYDPSNRRLGMREADDSLAMFGFYIWNNVRIGFQTFAGGLLAGIGTLWFLVANGVIIGSVAGYLTQVGYAQTFWSFVAGHSSLELSAIVLSGAAGLRLGMAVVSPGRLSRKAALVAASRPAVQLMYGAATMFVAAAFVEAFWSPHGYLPYGAKVAVGAAGWAVLLAYLSLAGRGRAG